MRRAIKNLLCLLAFAIALFFTTGCDLNDVVVDIIVPGYGGGVGVYPDYDYYYDDDYYDDDYYYDDDGFFFDFYADF